MIEVFIPFLGLAGFIGWAIGFTQGRGLKTTRVIADAHEDDLLKEVKRRRFEARLSDEIEVQVEKEAGKRPVAPY